jgi:sugar phosphate isomerase/epimerase
MKISYNTWAYSSFFVWVPSYTLDETIKRIAKLGYDGIEIGAAAPHAYPPHLGADRRAQVRDLLQEHNIALSSMLPAPSGGPGNNPASPYIEERRATVEHYKELAELTAYWGGKTLIYLPGWIIYGTSRRQAWEWSREVLTEIADSISHTGVTLVIEPTSHDTNLCVGADDAGATGAAAGATGAPEPEIDPPALRLLPLNTWFAVTSIEPDERTPASPASKMPRGATG